jgi:hypothetical protein
MRLLMLKWAGIAAVTAMTGGLGLAQAFPSDTDDRADKSAKPAAAPAVSRPAPPPPRPVVHTPLPRPVASTPAKPVVHAPARPVVQTPTPRPVVQPAKPMVSSIPTQPRPAAAPARPAISPTLAHQQQPQSIPTVRPSHPALPSPVQTTIRLPAAPVRPATATHPAGVAGLAEPGRIIVAQAAHGGVRGIHHEEALVGAGFGWQVSGQLGPVSGSYGSAGGDVSAGGGASVLPGAVAGGSYGTDGATATFGVATPLAVLPGPVPIPVGVKGDLSVGADQSTVCVGPYAGISDANIAAQLCYTFPVGYQSTLDSVTNSATDSLAPILAPLADPSTFTDPFVDYKRVSKAPAKPAR